MKRSSITTILVLPRKLPEVVGAACNSLLRLLINLSFRARLLTALFYYFFTVELCFAFIPHRPDTSFQPFPAFILPVALLAWMFGRKRALFIITPATYIILILMNMFAAWKILPPHGNPVVSTGMLLVFILESICINRLRQLFITRQLILRHQYQTQKDLQSSTTSLPHAKNDQVEIPFYINDETPMVDRVGALLDDYKIIRHIGQGSFGNVYLGEHIHHHTPAAIKVLSPRVLAHNYRHFIDEISAAFRLRHPSIIQLLAFGISTDESPFLVMSYATHGTLRQRHPRGSRLALNTIVSYLMPIAAALQYAHDQRVIHRDVKPENILIGADNQILLSDFGLAVIVPLERSMGRLEVEGTVTYIAPEQIRGRPLPASDQYSLAIMLYEWLAGTYPFHGSPLDLIQLHLSATPPSLLQQRPDLPPRIEEIVFKALSKKPADRFVSVQEFAATFAQASRTATTVTPPLLTPTSTSLPTTLSPSPSSTPPLIQTNQHQQITHSTSPANFIATKHTPPLTANTEKKVFKKQRIQRY